jgi:hypothetical protein
MSQFTTPLVADKISEKEWILKDSFEYHIGSYPSEEIIKVPIGFITDFASIPKVFWGILPPDGPYAKAAVIHDYCYRYGLYTRRRSDQIFLEGMEVLEVERWKRTTMYYAVRDFGWYSWYRRRIEQYLKEKKDEHGQ